MLNYSENRYYAHVQLYYVTHRKNTVTRGLQENRSKRSLATMLLFSRCCRNNMSIVLRHGGYLRVSFNFSANDERRSRSIDVCMHQGDSSSCCIMSQNAPNQNTRGTMLRTLSSTYLLSPCNGSVTHSARGNFPETSRRLTH